MRTRSWTTIVLAAAAMLGSGLFARAQQDVAPTVDEIVNKTNHVAYYQGQDGRATVTMTITDARGGKRTREFIILRRDDRPENLPEGREGPDADQRFYVHFEKPADLNRMVFMVWKHVAADKDDDRWLYQPALDNVKRIAASDKRTSFVGSHFFYEDVSGRNTADDTHELVKTTDTYYVLKNTPKDPKTVEFGHFEMWIHRATFIPVQTLYYDKQGRKVRTYAVEKVDKIQGHYTVTKARMTDLTDGSNTLIEYRDVKYDIGLPEDIFTERYLRSAPGKYLK